MYTRILIYYRKNNEKEKKRKVEKENITANYVKLEQISCNRKEKVKIF